MPLPASLANTLELPVVGSPLFIVSGPELVIAQCKAGIVGSFPALNARPVEKLDEWLSRIENELGEYKAKNPEKKVAPYAVNQICHASNDRLMQDMETCVKHKVPIIITSLRPPIEIVEAAHDSVYSNLFTGVHGNYLGPSIAAAGLDPGNLPVADKSKMNFGSGGNMKSKAWRDIWGSGQGIGQIYDAPPVAELVARLKAEFTEAGADFQRRIA